MTKYWALSSWKKLGEEGARFSLAEFQLVSQETSAENSVRAGSLHSFHWACVTKVRVMIEFTSEKTQKAWWHLSSPTFSLSWWLLPRPWHSVMEDSDEWWAKPSWRLRNWKLRTPEVASSCFRIDQIHWTVYACIVLPIEKSHGLLEIPAVTPKQQYSGTLAFVTTHRSLVGHTAADTYPYCGTLALGCMPAHSASTCVPWLVVSLHSQPTWPPARCSTEEQTLPGNSPLHDRWQVP